MADVENQAPEAATPETAAPTIGLADLQNAIKVIDYACEQGAFKGWATIEQVAAVRGKLSAFVAAATPAEEEKPAAAKADKKAGKKADKAAKTTKAAPAVKKVTSKPAGAKK